MKAIHATVDVSMYVYMCESVYNYKDENMDGWKDGCEGESICICVAVCQCV